MGTIFINRRRELDRIGHLARAAADGRPERHLAFVGVRRIGKSRLIEHYVDSKPSVVAIVVQMDEATTTLQAFLLSFVRETVSALARANEKESLPKTAGAIEIAGYAGALGSPVERVVQRALSLVQARRIDGQQVFAAAVSFPEEVSRALSLPVLVFADEFQHIVDLASYPPFSAGRRRSLEDAQRELLQVFRAQVERRPNVGWVVTGSGVRMLRRILGEGPLMGRFDEFLMESFDADDCEQLAEAIWRQMKVDWTDSALARVYRLTQGHPFYADVASREAAVAALQLDQPVSASMVDGAFMDAIQRPQGQIATACKEMYESLTQRAPGLRGALNAVAIAEPASLSEITERMQISSPPLVHRYIQDLLWLGLVEEGSDRTYVFADPVFRYWVARVSDPLSPKQLLPDLALARRAARHFEEAFLRERQLRGPLREGYVRETCRDFAGQHIDGRRFGQPGRHIALPLVSRIDRLVAYDNVGEVLGKPSEVELDLCFGDDVVWVGEVRDRSRPASVDDIRLAIRKAAFLRRAHNLPAGPTWFVSVNGFTAAALGVARTEGLYVSTLADMEAIRNEIATRRP